MSGKGHRDRTADRKRYDRNRAAIRWPTTPCRVCGQRIETGEAWTSDGMCDQCEYKATVAAIRQGSDNG